MTLERKIMRKIFGTTRTDYGYWRIKTNQEINGILYIKLCRGLRDGNPCLKDQLEDLKHVGKMRFWKI